MVPSVRTTLWFAVLAGVIALCVVEFVNPEIAADTSKATAPKKPEQSATLPALKSREIDAHAVAAAVTEQFRRNAEMYALHPSPNEVDEGPEPEELSDTQAASLDLNEMGGPHFGDAVTYASEDRWNSEQRNSISAGREQALHALFRSMSAPQALKDVECRETLCLIELHLAPDDKPAINAAQALARAVAVLENQDQRVLALVPVQSVDQLRGASATAEL